MKKLLILSFLYANLVIGQQVTFNVQSTFGYGYMEFTNVLPTDSCYYVNGLVKFKYKVSDQQSAWLTIHDMNGRLVAKLALLANETEVGWKTDGLAPGVYYYKATVLDNVPQKLVLIK